MTGSGPSFVHLIGGKPARKGDLSAVLPTGLSEDAPKITYGAYFHAVEKALRGRGLEPIRRGLEELTGERFDPERIDEVLLDSVKHGALYHVAKVTVRVGDRLFFLAMNSAVDPQRHAALTQEWETLESLSETAAAPYVPRALYLGQGVWDAAGGEARPFRFFLARWFDGFHEWHLGKGPGDCAESVSVWDGSASDGVLSDAQACQLMEQAAYILTLALDRCDFRHIHPWHHAAGDFVVAVQGNSLAVRLIAARNRGILISPGPERHERLAALAAFLFALTFRMRLDRDRGEGDLIWATARWLPAVLHGFFRGWTDGAPPDEMLSPEEILAAFRALDASDWEAVGNLLSDDIVVDPEEEALVSRFLPVHARDLHRSLHPADGPSRGLSPRRIERDAFEAPGRA